VAENVTASRGALPDSGKSESGRGNKCVKEGAGLTALGKKTGTRKKKNLPINKQLKKTQTVGQGKKGEGAEGRETKLCGAGVGRKKANGRKTTTATTKKMTSEKRNGRGPQHKHRTGGFAAAEKAVAPRNKRKNLIMGGPTTLEKLRRRTNTGVPKRKTRRTVGELTTTENGRRKDWENTKG